MSPKAEITTTIVTSATVQIKPTVRRRLLHELHTYTALKTQRDAADHGMSKAKDSLQSICEDNELEVPMYDGFTLEDASIKMVCASSKKLDRKRFVELGGDLQILDDAMIEMPKKPYLSIRQKGERNGNGHGEG